MILADIVLHQYQYLLKVKTAISVLERLYWGTPSLWLTAELQDLVLNFSLMYS